MPGRLYIQFSPMDTYKIFKLFISLVVACIWMVYSPFLDALYSWLYDLVMDENARGSSDGMYKRTLILASSSDWVGDFGMTSFL